MYLWSFANRNFIIQAVWNLFQATRQKIADKLTNLIGFWFDDSLIIWAKEIDEPEDGPEDIVVQESLVMSIQ